MDYATIVEKTTLRAAGLIVAGLVAIACLGASGHLAAEDPAPVLVVPACPAMLQVAPVRPENAGPQEAGPAQLVEADHADVLLPAQWISAIGADGSAGDPAGRLAATIPPRQGAEGKRRFRIEPGEGPEPAAGGFQWADVDDKSLKLTQAGQPVLVYNHGVIVGEHVPESDSRRTRACYVHPVWGLNGEMLTDDFSKDHYHHHGVFWTWPHVEIEGKQYDLWADGGGIRQRFVAWLARQAGPEAAVLGVENGWFVGDRKVMIERAWLRVHRAAGDERAVDIDLFFIPVDRPVTLRGAEGKSYGGLTVRFRPPSEKEAVITVPAGRTTADLPDTRLEWADFTSRFGPGPELSGAAVFIDPAHPDYPPTWLTRHYGPLCVGWPGVHAKTFDPGAVIHLSYRLWIHKAEVDTDRLKRAYSAYAAATAAAWQ